MTAPEWAVEKAAGLLRGMHFDGQGCGDSQSPGACSNCYGPSPMTAREVARAALAAVWPETTTEWGVRFEDGFVKSWRGNEQAARRHEREVRSHPVHPGVLVTREARATEWREVQP